MWTISAALSKAEFLGSLRDIDPEMMNGLLDVVWKMPHAHVEELLDRISQVHPDKQVAKAARRALFRARSGKSRERTRAGARPAPVAGATKRARPQTRS